MKLVFAAPAMAEYRTWEAQDPDMQARIDALIQEALRKPFEGMGKPEALRGRLSGWWSRRIAREHRLVYRVTGEGKARALEIAQCRYHV
ncbi:MAG: Txe/YoeB family addiction module toxin [Sphingomonas sp.]